MTRIAFYCVNYHTYKELDHFLASVMAAAKACSDSATVSVFIADNTDSQIQDILPTSKEITTVVFPFHQNIGYFGAIRKMMQQENPSHYDYTIISNVDIILEQQCLQQLVTQPQTTADTGWIAPCIFSAYRHYDRNPMAVNRYSRRHLQLLRLAFKYPFIHYIYHHTLRKRKKYQTHKPGNIYAGHGACMILTREYFNRCGIISYPIFLYGEELYVAEQCRLHKLDVIYNPQIPITDYEGASTSKMRKRFYYQCNYQGIDYIIKNYY